MILRVFRVFDAQCFDMGNVVIWVTFYGLHKDTWKKENTRNPAFNGSKQEIFTYWVLKFQKNQNIWTFFWNLCKNYKDWLSISAFRNIFLKKTPLHYSGVKQTRPALGRIIDFFFQSEASMYEVVHGSRGWPWTTNILNKWTRRRKNILRFFISTSSRRDWPCYYRNGTKMKSDYGST